jgi:hypothetical protein
MTLFVYPPITVATTGLATEAKQDVTNTKLDTLSSKTAQTGFFTLAYDQIVPTTDATHDYYTSKLAGVSKQVLTITYADATKAVATDYKVV